METKPKSRKGLWVAVVVLILMLSISVMVNLGMILVGAIAASSSMGTKADRPQLEEVLQSGRGDTKVVQLEVSGPIMRSVGGGLLGSSRDMVEDLLLMIERASNDKSVKAIILDISSPGGAVTATDEIYKALTDFRASSEDRRIITFVRDAAVSGSYWLAVAGDRIIAQPTSMIGSIGVILQSINFSGLSEKIGVSGTTITSGSNKDLLNPWEETREDHIVLLQAMIDESHDYFKEVILRHRDMDSALLDEVADGRVVTSRVAMENGLIDAIGYWDSAIEETGSLIGTDKFRVVKYRRRGLGFMEIFGSSNVPSLRQYATPRLMSILEL